MQTESSDPIPFEIRCENCEVSFPRETRRCLHCGEKLGSRFSLGPAEDPPQAAEGEFSVARRLGSAGLWAVLALSAVLVRLCEG